MTAAMPHGKNHCIIKGLISYSLKINSSCAQAIMNLKASEGKANFDKYTAGVLPVNSADRHNSFLRLSYFQCACNFLRRICYKQRSNAELAG